MLSTTKVQTRLHIFDITPSEAYWDEVDDHCSPRSFYTKEGLYDSIKKEGLHFQLKVDRFGNVINGNMRWWTCLRLFLEGDMRFEYLPVEFNFYAGYFPLDKEEFTTAFKLNLTIGKADRETKKVLHDMLVTAKNTLQPVIPTKTYQEYDIPMEKVGGYRVAWRVDQVMRADQGVLKVFDKKIFDTPEIFNPMVLTKKQKEMVINAKQRAIKKRTKERDPIGTGTARRFALARIFGRK